jgi:hypothetical protein
MFGSMKSLTGAWQWTLIILSLLTDSGRHHQNNSWSQIDAEDAAGCQRRYSSAAPLVSHLSSGAARTDKPLCAGIVLTNDGHAILREIDVAHPAAKVRTLAAMRTRLHCDKMAGWLQ